MGEFNEPFDFSFMLFLFCSTIIPQQKKETTRNFYKIIISVVRILNMYSHNLYYTCFNSKKKREFRFLNIPMHGVLVYLDEPVNIE